MELIVSTKQDLEEIISKCISAQLKNFHTTNSEEKSDPSITDRLITANELADHLHVVPQTIFRWMKDSKIPSINIGKSLRFNLQAVLKALDKKNNAK